MLVPGNKPLYDTAMTESVNLEIPADTTLLPVVRMVVGGMAARADLTISELDDLYLAVEELLRAARDPVSTPRYRLQIEADGGAVQIVAGPFYSPSLLQQLDGLCCQLVQRVVTFDVHDDQPGAYMVTLTKARKA
jgi:hypothetical protein